MVIVK